MKKLVLIISILLSKGVSKNLPCEDFTCDSMVVKTIFKNIGFEAIPVNEWFTDTLNGRIVYLNLASRNLSTIPAEIGYLTALSSLKLAHNNITSLPSQITNLPSLTRLELFANQMTGLPTELLNIETLEWLDISRNELTLMPREIGNLSKLCYLSIHDNKLTGLPNEMENLTELTSLEIQNNSLTEYPIIINNLTSLKALSLSNNQISEIPPGLSNLGKLDILELDNNQLSILPIDITSLNLAAPVGQAHWVKVNNNKLCEVSDSIAIWIDKHSIFSNWQKTQRLDDIHLCDGTLNIDPMLNPNNNIVIRQEPYSQHIAISAGKEISKMSIFIYNIQGKLVTNITKTTEPTIWNSDGQTIGVYYIKAIFNQKRIIRKFVLK